MGIRRTFLNHEMCVITRRGDAGAKAGPGDGRSRCNVVGGPWREKARVAERGCRPLPSGGGSLLEPTAEKSLGGECIW
jgi:hypothetical protein